jgi:sugar (pentulose or hexulose) kinase
MAKLPVIAIFDIGKTNKKILLFDENYSLVYEQIFQLKEIVDEDGDACEDIILLKEMFVTTLDRLSELNFEIKAINISAYGASLVYLDENGGVCAPLYSYLKKYPDELKDQFYSKYGGEVSFSKQTASPVLGSLNSGMQLYRVMQMQPDVFAQVKYALHLPQYFGWLLTGKPFSEITSIGCHTGLWDFEKNAYHEWVSNEGVTDKLPEMFPSDQAMSVIVNNKKIWVGTGLHDTSAALIPYLKSFTAPFILLSTGTWCISINPFNHEPLTDDELKNDCLFYVSYEGMSVKASRLFAGYEHEQYCLQLAEHFHVDCNYHKTIEFDPTAVNMQATTYFDPGNLSAYKTYSEAYHQFMAHIVSQQIHSTRLVMHNTDGNTKIFVDGGFSKNNIYMQLLALALPELKVYAACVPQASALGAALAIHPYWNTKPISNNLIDLKHYPAYQFL